jgi:uncharacterized protein (DUF58 family)
MRGGLWWTVIVLLAVLAVLLQQPLLAAFVLGLALAGGASELWSRRSLSRVSYRRILGDSHLAFGEESTLTLEFVNAKLLPLAWLVARDEYPPGVTLLTGTVDATQGARRAWLTNLVALRWYERVRRVYHIRGDHRGLFRFGPAEIVSGDMFGFRRQLMPVPGSDDLIVYPKIIPLEHLGLPAGRPMGDWLAPRRLLEDPQRFAMTRDYVPGDNPRYLHWKATARTGRLQSKVFDPSATLSLTLAVDVQTAAGAYEYEPDALEFVISAAASLAMQALQERHSVGLCANGLQEGQSGWVQVRPGRHPEQLHQLLTALACLDAVRGTPFETMIGLTLPTLPYGSTLVALTAWPRDANIESLLAVQPPATACCY